MTAAQTTEIIIVKLKNNDNKTVKTKIRTEAKTEIMK